MWRRILFILFILFCIELGLFLFILPWHEMWANNYVLSRFPGLRPLLLNNFTRGALSGLGLVNLWIGLSDAWHFRENIARLDEEDRHEREAVRLDAEGASVPPPGRVSR